MGGQQFLQHGTLVDTTMLNKVLQFDSQKGTIEVEAGIQWPALIDYLQQNSNNESSQGWAIAQKQTGADRLTIGGSLGSNVHGRNLSSPPIISDIVQFKIVMHDGRIERCSRSHNRELFKLAVGGYGLFGLIYSVTLRLVPRKVLVRTVEIIDRQVVIERFDAHIGKGATYGDFQFSIDNDSADFLRAGIMSTYTPTELSAIDSHRKILSEDAWEELLYLAHWNKAKAFSRYRQHYLQTNGQLYWSDTFQLATYLDDYHRKLDSRFASSVRGREVITELYVPRQSLSAFLADAAELLREQKADVIYGTVRLIEKDVEAFMPWAKSSFACVVLNLHVESDEKGIAAAKKTFRDLIQLAIGFRGCFYLTYHRFATTDQLLACYPELPEFLRKKSVYDPQHVFLSDWFKHIYQAVNQGKA